MAIDRSKYRKADVSEMSQKSAEMAEREQSGRSDFLKVESGINKFRFFPAPMKAKSSLFMFPSVKSYLPFMEDEKDDKGNKTGKQVEKRRPIFNSKVHLGISRDIVEEYIDAVREKLSAEYDTKEKLYAALKPMTDWKTGIRPNTSWCTYAIKIVGKKETRGRLDLSSGVKKQLDTLSLRQSEQGEAIVVDLVSDVEDGICVQWTNNPNAADAKQKNLITLLFEEKHPLSDEDLEWLESQDTLESLFENSFTMNDFKNQLKGLQRFDKVNKFNVFETPSFQSVIKAIQKEIESKLGNSGKTSSKGNNETSVSSSSSDEVELPTILEEMDKKTLLELKDALELDVDIKTTTPPSKIRKLLYAGIVESYELEGDSEEINESITDIITQAMGDEGDGEGEGENQSENQSENNSPIEEEGEGEGEGEGEQENEPEEEEKPKKSRLLEKYKNRKK